MRKMNRDRAPGRQQYGEELLCEPPHGPDDVLCSGSEDDYYETPRDRRILYERQARRFLDGYIPTLLSASLSGPFDTKSGWTNPWRSRRTSQRRGHAPAEKMDAGPALDTAARVADEEMSRAAVGSAGEEMDEVDETLQLDMTVRHGKADVPARVHKPDPSLDALHCSSFSRQSTISSNPYMNGTDLDRIASWRDTVDANIALREEFWLPDNRDNGAGGPKRSRQTEWLRRKAMKRRKTDHAGSSTYDSPIQVVMQNRPQHRLGPKSAPGSTTYEEELAAEVSVSHYSLSQLPVETPLPGSIESHAIHRRGTGGSVVEPAVTSALPRSTQATGDALSRNSSAAAFKSSASTTSSHAAPHESLPSVTPDSESTIPQASDTSSRVNGAARGSSKANPEVWGKREGMRDGKELKFESQGDESFFYRARPRTRTGLRSQASCSSPHAAVQETDTPQTEIAKGPPHIACAHEISTGIEMASEEEAPHSDGRPKHVSPCASEVQSLNQEFAPSVPVVGSPANATNAADTPHDADAEDGVERAGSPDAGVLPIQIPMSQEEWGLGLYKVIAEHFDLSRATEGRPVGEAIKRLSGLSLQISHTDETHEAPLVSAGEDQEPCREEMEEAPADDEADHTLAPTANFASSPRETPQKDANKEHAAEPEEELTYDIADTIVGSVGDEDMTIHVKEDTKEEPQSSLLEEKLVHPKRAAKTSGDATPAQGAAALGSDDTTLSVLPVPSQSHMAGEEKVHRLATNITDDLDRSATDSTANNLRDENTALSSSKRRYQSPWLRSTEPPLTKDITNGPSLLPAPHLLGLDGIARSTLNVAASQQSPWNRNETEACLLEQHNLTPRSAAQDFAPESTRASSPEKSAHGGSGEQATPAVSSQVPPSTPETKHSGLPTPDFSLSIKSFAKFRTPSPPKRKSLRVSLSNNHLPSTQALVDAALSNPWAKASTKKPGRRVSFAPLPGETPSRGSEGTDKENEDEDAGLGDDGKAVRGRRGRAVSPPIAAPTSDLPDYDTRFTSHFEAMAKASRMRLAARRRRPRLARRLLPSASQQVADSPGVGAMAEAFIAAEELAEQPPAARARADEDIPSSWPEGEEDDDEVELPSFGAAEAVDDVSAVIHNLSDFLDSWDVDDELAKARPGGGEQVPS